ncbi:MAG: glucosaminidase domain-containing protein [Bacilli bacterium]|nr:glucosaminidase domain-containing protein [Bacilli bacterium]
MKDNKKIIAVIVVCLLCAISFLTVKNKFFASESVLTPLKSIISNVKDERTFNYNNEVIYKDATVIKDNDEVKPTSVIVTDESIELIGETKTANPYDIAPTFEDDGSIIFEGMTLTELTDKLNKSLKGYMTNTGYFFAEYTKRTGLDPYLAVSIVLLESGCKWTCSSLTRNCNNIGGLKGGQSCNGGSYRRYNTLGEGIDGFLDIIYKNYYLKGLTTPELMAPRYAQSSTWAEKVNAYINEVRSK